MCRCEKPSGGTARPRKNARENDMRASTTSMRMTTFQRANSFLLSRMPHRVPRTSGATESNVSSKNNFPKLSLVSLRYLACSKSAACSRRRQEKQRLAEERKRWEEQRARERDEQRLEELLKEAGQYRARIDLLAYLTHLERYVQDNDVEVTEFLTRGLAEARALADSLDKTETRLGLLQRHGLVTESEIRYKWIWGSQ